MIVGDLVDAGVAEIRTGPFGTQLKASDYVETGRPVLNVRNVGFGDVRAEKLEHIDEQTARRLSGHLLQSGDIVFGRKGAVERHAFIRDDFVGALQGSDCIRLRLSDTAPVRAHFVSFTLRTAEHQAWMQAFCSHGATMASLNQDILRQIRLPDLPLAAQDAVIEVLGSIDDLIDNNRRRVEVLEEMARAIYREWFVRFRYPGYEDVHLVDSPLGPIPDGWTVAPLGSIATVNRESRTPNQDEVVRYLDISALGERAVGQMSEINGDEVPGRARRVVQAGDVVWSMVRPNRRAHALLVEPGADWIASTGLAVLSPTGISSTWLFEMASTQQFSDYLVSQEGGAAYPAVKPKDFERAPIVVPTPELDCAFAQRVAPLHRLAWWLRSQSAALASMRDLLLPNLVTGQIDVSHLDLDVLTEAATA